MNTTDTSHRGAARLSVALLLAWTLAALAGCDDRGSVPKPSGANRPAPVVAAVAGDAQPATDEALVSRLRAPAGIATKDGIAAIVLVDTSGSMSENVPDADGTNRPKIDIARRAAESIIRQMQTFAKDQPNQATLLGLYDFSERAGQPSCRPVMALGPPDPAAAGRALQAMRPEGNTPIGEAIIKAKQDLDRSGQSRLHVLVITDGQNTSGVDPGQVMRAIQALPQEQRPGVYFIAFDVDAAVFSAAKNAGALVLPAANGKQLQDQLDFVMGNKILLEK